MHKNLSLLLCALLTLPESQYPIVSRFLDYLTEGM